MSSAAQILVSNKAGEKGAIAVIADETQTWTCNETLAQWIKDFPRRSFLEYHRNFTLIIVTDKTKEQLQYLVDNLIVDGKPIGNKWYFVEPSRTSPEWTELYHTGQTRKTFSEIQPFLRERTA